jgi:Bacterial Ig-like domain (group 2)
MATLSVGAFMQFTATGHYRNGSTADITNQVLWSVDSPQIAIISDQGLVVGEQPGTVNVAAGAGSITAFEVLMVTNP